MDQSLGSKPSFAANRNLGRQGKLRRNCPHEGLVGHMDCTKSLAFQTFQQLELNAGFADGNQSDIFSKLSTRFNPIHQCSKAHLHLLYTVDLTIRMATLPIQFINVVKNIYTSYGISNYTYGNCANPIHQCSKEHLHLLWYI